MHLYIYIQICVCRDIKTYACADTLTFECTSTYAYADLPIHIHIHIQTYIHVQTTTSTLYRMHNTLCNLHFKFFIISLYVIHYIMHDTFYMYIYDCLRTASKPLWQHSRTTLKITPRPPQALLEDHRRRTSQEHSKTAACMMPFDTSTTPRPLRRPTRVLEDPTKTS